MIAIFNRVFSDYRLRLVRFKARFHLFRSICKYIFVACNFQANKLIYPFEFLWQPNGVFIDCTPNDPYISRQLKPTKLIQMWRKIFCWKIPIFKMGLNWKWCSRRSIYIIVAKWIRTFQLSFSMLHRLFVCYTERMRISQQSFWKRKSFRLDLISRKLSGGKLGVKSTKNLLHRSTQITYGVCLVNGYV